MRGLVFLLTLISLLYFSKASMAQHDAIDSLEGLLKIEKDELKQVKLLNDLFNVQYPSNFEKGLQYASLGLRKTKKLDQNNSENVALLSEC